MAELSGPVPHSMVLADPVSSVSARRVGCACGIACAVALPQIVGLLARVADRQTPDRNAGRRRRGRGCCREGRDVAVSRLPVVLAAALVLLARREAAAFVC